MDRIKVERAIAGLTEWQKHVQTNSDIDRDISTAIEALKAQLFSEGTTSDMISRQWLLDCINDGWIKFDTDKDANRFIHLVRDIAPTIQPVAIDTNVGDTISKFIDGLEEIFADLRERHVDDSVCGLCEYDGAYIGQSGDWCNECPGFDRDDCFKLSDETRKKWTDEIIKALPPHSPNRRKGEWLPDNNCAYEMRFVCSCCKESEVVPTIGFTKYRPLWDFCPNCGAYMRGGQDG